MRTTELADTGLVSKGYENDTTRTCGVEREQNPPPLAQPANHLPSASQKADPPNVPLIRTHLKDKDLSNCESALAPVNNLSRWETFCKSRNLNKFRASIENGIDFLASLYEQGLGYSAINTARSALSSVLDFPDSNTSGTHPLVTRFLKGAFG